MIAKHYKIIGITSPAFALIIQMPKLAWAPGLATAYLKPLPRYLTVLYHGLKISSPCISAPALVHSHQTKSKGSLLPGTRWSGSGPDSAWHRKVRAGLQDSRSAIYLLLHLPSLWWRVKQIHWHAHISVLSASLPALQRNLWSNVSHLVCNWFICFNNEF